MRKKRKEKERKEEKNELHRWKFKNKIQINI